jgi:hypothetical protein
MLFLLPLLVQAIAAGKNLIIKYCSTNYRLLVPGNRKSPKTFEQSSQTFCFSGTFITTFILLLPLPLLPLVLCYSHHCCTTSNNIKLITTSM